MTRTHTRTSTPFRIAGANLKNKTDALDRLLDHDLAAAVLSEASRLDRPLARLDGHGYRVTQIAGAPDERRGDEVAVLVRDRYPSHGQVTRLISEQVDRFERIAPDRALASDRFVCPQLGAVALIGIHPDAGVAGIDDPDHPIVKEYFRSMRALRVEITRAKADGFHPIVVGDVNMRDIPRDAPWSPFRVFASTGLLVASEGIDAQAYSPAFKLATWHVLDRGVIGPDHPTTVAGYLRRK